jgi:hypothetical protein
MGRTSFVVGKSKRRKKHREKYAASKHILTWIEKPGR